VRSLMRSEHENGESLGARQNTIRAEKSMEERAEDEREIHTQLDEDTYGAALFSIVADVSELFGAKTDSQDIRPTSLKVLRLVFVNIVLATNYFLQFGMLYFIKSFVVDAAVEKVAEKEAAGIAHPRLIDILLLHHPKFLSLILILWTLTSLIELRKVETFVHTVNALPWVNELGKMLIPDIDEDGNQTFEIKGLTKGVWAAIMMMITVPKLGIITWLFVLGFQWLASTDQPGDLILNALALAFVVNIDEQLFEALIPGCVKEKMRFVSLTNLKPVYNSDQDERAADLRADRGSYVRSMFYFFLPVAVSMGYIHYMQMQIEGLSGAVTE